MIHELLFSGVTFNEYKKYRLICAVNGTVYGGYSPGFYLKVNDGSSDTKTLKTIVSSNVTWTGDAIYTYSFEKVGSMLVGHSNESFIRQIRLNASSSGKLLLTRKKIKLTDVTLTLSLEGSNYAT